MAISANVNALQIFGVPMTSMHTTSRKPGGGPNDDMSRLMWRCVNENKYISIEKVNHNSEFGHNCVSSAEGLRGAPRSLHQYLPVRTTWPIFQSSARLCNVLDGNWRVHGQEQGRFCRSWILCWDHLVQLHRAAYPHIHNLPSV